MIFIFFFQFLILNFFPITSACWVFFMWWTFRTYLNINKKVPCRACVRVCAVGRPPRTLCCRPCTGSSSLRCGRGCGPSAASPSVSSTDSPRMSTYARSLVQNGGLGHLQNKTLFMQISIIKGVGFIKILLNKYISTHFTFFENGQ